MREEAMLCRIVCRACRWLCRTLAYALTGHGAACAVRAAERAAPLIALCRSVPGTHSVWRHDHPL